MARIVPIPEDTVMCGECLTETAKWLVSGSPIEPKQLIALCGECVHNYVRDRWWQE